MLLQLLVFFTIVINFGGLLDGEKFVIHEIIGEKAVLILTKQHVAAIVLLSPLGALLTVLWLAAPDFGRL